MHIRAEEQEIVQQTDQGEQAVGEEGDGIAHVEHIDGNENQVNDRQDPGLHGNDKEHQELGLRVGGTVGQNHAQVQVVGHVAVEVSEYLRRNQHLTDEHHIRGAEDHGKQVHQYDTCQIEQVKFEGTYGHFHMASEPVEEIQENDTQHGASAQLFRQQPGDQPPDLTLEDGSFIEAEEVIQEFASVGNAGEEDHRVAQTDIEHQIPDAPAAVAVAEPLKLAAKIMIQLIQLPKMWISYILPVKRQKVHRKIVNFFVHLLSKKVLTFLHKSVEYLMKIAYSLIKSGGGNGPMKPGNLAEAKVPNPAANER